MNQKDKFYIPLIVALSIIIPLAVGDFEGISWGASFYKIYDILYITFDKCMYLVELVDEIPL
ncbi:hypothetical protein N9Y26_00880 [bacterium]|nr:hypothetical protein [bacterium]